MPSKKTEFTFPFGEPVMTVVQKDQTPKKVFVLGVYASAVHARWMSPEGQEIAKALAVASEPEIFWRGEGAEEIIARIKVPPEAGKLVAAVSHLNGPSAKALDEKILAPLGFDRNSSWLCDLVPYSCQNQKQKKKVQREYNENAEFLNLPAVHMQAPPRSISDERRQEILEELRQSEADLLITLGDQPILNFLNFVADEWDWISLAELFEDRNYGEELTGLIGGRDIRVLPLVHPRQIEGMGQHNPEWKERHGEWVRAKMG